jgi:arginine repressor
MGATSKPLLTTKMSLNGKEIEVPIPQVFNEEIDDFEALKGKNGVQLTGLEGLLQKDYATQTTLTAVLTKLSDLATQTALVSVLTKLGDIASQTTLTDILTKLNDPASQATLAAVLAKLGDIASQATLAEVLSKLSAVGIDPSKNGVTIKGSLMTVTHTTVSVTTLTGPALAVNVNRKYALLVNNSQYTQFIKLGADAILNQGIRLNANGGSYEMTANLGNLYTGAINVIGTATGTLLVTEGV